MDPNQRRFNFLIFILPTGIKTSYDKLRFDDSHSNWEEGTIHVMSNFYLHS